MATGLGRGVPLGRGAGIAPMPRREVRESLDGNIQIKIPGGAESHSAEGHLEEPSVVNGVHSDAEEVTEVLKQWNPMMEDYKDPKFNSYSSGPGRNLPADRQAPRLPNVRRTQTNAIKLYVGGIPAELTETGLSNLFARAGTVVDAVKLPSKLENATHSFGFVTLSSVREANEAIRLFDRRKIGRCFLKVALALSKEQKEQRDKEKMEQEEFINSLPSNRKEHVRNEEPALDVEELNAALPQKTTESGYESGGAGDARSHRNMPPVSEVSPSPGRPTRTADLVDLPCVICGKTSKKRCPKCKTPYCSRECQTNDWPTHRPVCRERDSYQSDFENRFEIIVNDEVLNTPSMDVMGDARPKKNVRVKLNDVEKESLPDKQVKVMLTHLTSPQDFCVVLMDKLEQELTPLLQQLNQECGETVNAGTGSYLPVEGELCLARFQLDNNWYRAVVNQINLDGTVEVTYVDFGNAEQISASRLHRCKPEFLKLKLQGIRCCLNGIDPTPEGWSSRVMEFVRTKMRTDSQYLARSMGMHRGKNVVDFVDPIDNSAVPLVLVSQGYATKASGKSAPPSSSPKLSPPCLPTAHVVNEHQLPTMASRLQRGQKIQVSVVEPVSPGEFWVQLQDESKLAELEQLQLNLFKEYNSRPPKNSYRMTTFNMVAAKFIDGLWYRSQVISYDTQTASVRYLDFGNSHTVQFSEMHHLDSPFCTLPFQAMCCSLAGIVSTAGSAWSEEAQLLMQELTMNHTFTATVVGQNNWSALLELHMDGRGTLNDLLVTQGVAQHSTGESSGKDPGQSPQPKPVMAISVPAKATVPPKASHPHSTPQNPPTPPQPAVRKVPLLTDLSPAKVQKPVEPVGINLTDASSPSNLSVQLVSMSEEIQSLSLALQAAYHSYEGTYKPVQVGQLVAARFSMDNNWYRAVVQELKPSSALVRFIDYGNKEEVNHDMLAELKAELMSYDIQAVPCELNNVVLGEGQEWKAEYLPLFVAAKMKMFSKHQGVVRVDILEYETGASFSEALINQGVLSVAGQSTSTSVNVAPKPVPTLPTSPPAAAAVSSAPPTACTAEIKATVPAVSSSPPVPMFVDLPVAQLPKQTAPVMVILTDASAPGCLSVQLYDMYEDVTNLCQQLQAVYSGYTGSYTPSKVDQLVAACFSGDNNWYRAVVQQLKPAGAVVKFIDYGNTEEVSSDKLAELKADFLQGSVQAVLCGLSGVVTSECRAWDPQYLPIFQFYNCVVVDTKDGIPQVDLLHHETNASYTESLIDQGILTTPAAVKVLADLQSPAVPDVDSPVLCMVTEVQSAESFWIQIAEGEQAEQIPALGTALATTYGQYCNSYTPQDKELVAAVFPDDKSWYRAEVQAVNGDQVTVQFVDYGNSSVVTPAAIAPLEDSLMQYPVQAIHCQLHNVSLSPGAQWKPDYMPVFKLYTLLVKVQGQDKLSVDLLNELNESVSKSVLRLFPSAPVATKTAVSASAAAQAVIPPAAQKAATCTTSSGLAPVSALPAAAPKAAPLAAQASYTIRDLPMLDVPCTKDPTVVIVQDAPGPELFWIQANLPDVPDMLATVTTSLQDLYASYVGTECGYEVDQLVAAKFSQDQNWYRGQVLVVNPKSITVRFIDFGNTESVEMSCLAELHASLRKYPALAICCCLPGVTPHPSQPWEPQKLYIGQQLNAVFQKQRQDIYEVELYDPQTNEPVSEALVAKGVLTAVMVTPVTSPKSTAAAAQTPCTPPSGGKPQARIPGTPPSGGKSPQTGSPQTAVHPPANMELEKQKLSGDGDVIVYPWYVVDPSCFYAQWQDASLQRQLGEQQEQLKKMAPTMRKLYEPAVGMMAIGLNPADDLWYRVQILEVKPKQVKVVFFDFGDTAVIDKSQLVEITAQFLVLPKQAIPFCIDKIQGTGPGGQYTDAAKMWFAAAISEKRVSPTGAVWVNDRYMVQDLHHIPAAHMSSMGAAQPEGSVLQELIASGHAVSLEAVQPAAAAQAPEDASVPLASHVPALPLPAKEFVGMVVHVEDLSQFYIQPQDEDTSSKVATITQALNTDVQTMDPYKPSSGELVAGLFEGLWFRAEVLTPPTDSHAKLLFIDYGNQADVELSHIQPLDAAFLSVPRLAVRCCLSSGIQKHWKSEASSAFAPLVLNQGFSVKVAHSVDGLTHVDLITFEGVSVLDQMEAQGFLAPAPAASTRSPVPKTTKPSPTVCSPPSALEKARSPQHQGFSTQQPHQQSGPSGQPPKHKAYTLKHLPEKTVPAEFTGCVCMAISPQDFYCQIQSPEIEQENVLRMEMNQYCNALAADPSFKPEVEELCCARFRDDKTWYRAFVKKKRSADEKRLVIFIDFGNTQPCSLDELRPFNDSLTSVPAQAVLCCLDGVTDPTKAICEKFQQLTQDQPHTGKVVKQDGMKYTVHLTLSSGQSVRDLLSPAPRATVVPSAVPPVISPPRASVQQAAANLNQSDLAEQNAALKRQLEELQKEMQRMKQMHK